MSQGPREPPRRTALFDRLSFFVAAQACLLFYDLDLLPLWGDEYATLQRAALAPGDLLGALAGNVHPPLYFLLVHYWMKLPWPGSPISQARALSVVATLAAFVAFDRLWLADADARTRRWFRVLWTLSPFLLLYSRMARSYSLQLVLAAVALRAGWLLVRKPRSATLLLAFAAAETALAYTHYLPAVAVGAAVALALAVGAVRERDRTRLLALLASAAVAGVLYAPWLLRLREAVGLVAERAPQRLAGGAFLDSVVALAHAFVSLSFGESLPLAVLAIAAVVAPGLLFLLWRGVNAPAAQLELVAPALAISFAGAIGWVAAPFVAARLTWFFPFYLLWLLAGRVRAARLGNFVCVALLATSLASIFAYFAREGFLNRAYVLPVEEIAARIRDGSTDGNAVVFLDHVRTNLEPIRPLLPEPIEVALLDAGTSADQIRDIVARRWPGVVWLLASTRNEQVPSWMAAVRSAMGGASPPEVRFFAPHSALEMFLLRRLGDPDPPSHAIVMWELRR